MLRTIRRIQLQNLKIRGKIAKYKTQTLNMEILLKAIESENTPASTEDANGKIAEYHANVLMEDPESVLGGDYDDVREKHPEGPRDI